MLNKIFIENKHKPINRNIKWCLIILLAWAVESLISVFWIEGQIWGYDYKRPLNFIEYFVILLVLSTGIDNKRILYKSIYLYIICAYLIAGLTLLKSIGFDIPGKERTTLQTIGIFKYGVIAICGNVDSYASLTLPLIPIVIISLTCGHPLKNNKILLLILFFLTIFMISLNGSRSTYLSIIFSICVSLYLSFKYNNQIYLIKKFFYLIMSILLINLVIYSEVLYNLLASIRSRTIEQRLMGYRIAMEMSFNDYHHFIWGAGKDNFLSKIYLILNERIVPHNAIIDELVSDGFIGVMLMVLFFLIVVQLSVKNIHIASLSNDVEMKSISIIFTASIFTILFEGLATNITPTPTLWLLISFILSAYNIWDFDLKIYTNNRSGIKRMASCTYRATENIVYNAHMIEFKEKKRNEQKDG
ncbi:O-antigen ligase family protein [Desulfobacterales bacterium HSG17]|nr:O-antigen ligase family protein [Desulfobacterales bacterium HSG17]